MANNIREEIFSITGEEVLSFEPAGGGCIADSGSVVTRAGNRYFVKHYSGRNGRMVARAEVEGLNEISKAGAIRSPGVIGVSGQVIVLEYIPLGTKTKIFWEEFGRSLADMHRYTSNSGHGFISNNFIGNNMQKNRPFIEKWSDFYAEARLIPQFRMMVANGYADTVISSRFDRLIKRLPELVDDKTISASLLHGDLWLGNFIVASDGNAVLIDPAVYYGDRETDLAMTKLFGGFDERFYSAYREAWPLEPGYSDREVLYKLYHQMNHLNLFGAGYLGSVRAGLEKLT